MNKILKLVCAIVLLIIFCWVVLIGAADYFINQLPH